MFVYTAMSETIGQQLKRARLARNLTIEQVVKEIHIRSHILSALEAGELESLPSATQARGFLKIYADYLGLVLEDLLAQKENQLPLPPASSTAEERKESKDEGGSPQSVLDGVMDEPGLRARKQPVSKSQRGKRKPEPGDEAVVSLPEQASSMDGSTPETTGGHTPEKKPENAALFKPAQVSPSGEVFTRIGATLSQRRESLGLSLEEIERHIHVRKQYLENLEKGQFEDLPSSVQARGMLNNYSRFLDLDVDVLLLEFADGLQAELAERKRRIQAGPGRTRGKPTRSLIPPLLRRILSPDILVGGGVLITLVVFAVWGTTRIIRLSAAATPEPTTLSISNVLLSSPITAGSLQTSTPDLRSSPVGTETGSTLEIAPPAGTAPVNIILAASHSTWVKVIVDNLVAYEGLLTPGVAYPYEADIQIEVITGDGSMVTVIYNQSNLGVMGSYGEVVDRIYTATTILLPTATFTPSPTITQTHSITPRPSATPRPTATPRP